MLVPFGVVTVICTVPLPVGTVALICVSETTVKEDRAVPNLTWVAPVSPLPVMTTAVPAGPLLGLTEDTTGAAATARASVRAAASGSAAGGRDEGAGGVGTAAPFSSPWSEAWIRVGVAVCLREWRDEGGERAARGGRRQGRLPPRGADQVGGGT
ncbi:hypothetical protein GCM10010246_18650 [Streptomyces cuspidosporus]|uniref:Secreted protein n=1 Tax=Streptomyces cuspidosporus TaxID=66882 RepID=A0ABN3FPR4_9ACTN